MDRLEAMGVLLAAVEAGSLSGAARHLAMPLPTVSRKVADLEAHLKTQLLIRSTRRLALTDAGKSYIAACRRILEDVSAAERAASGEYQAPRGELIITAPIAFGRLHTLPIANAFLKAYPEIDIRLLLADRVVNLIDDHIDLAVRIGALPDSGFIATRLGDLRRVVCASPAYFAAHGTPQTPGELEAHHCISFEWFAPADVWTFRVDGTDLSVPVHARLAVSSAEAAIDAAIAGIGIARVVSYQAAAALRAGTLVRVLRDFEPAVIPIHLLHAGNRFVPLKLRAFLDFATPRLRTAVAEVAAQTG